MSTELEANRANWDERVPVHLRAYDAEGFVADPTRITSVARDDLALMAPHLPAPHDAAQPLAGLDLLHLQCHVGTDTLSFARLGAAVTGLDFSPASIAAARDLAQRAGLEAAFVESDVAQAALGGRTFDVVHQHRGTGWPCARGRRPSRALRPGGVFLLRDGHPALSPSPTRAPTRPRAG